MDGDIDDEHFAAIHHASDELLYAEVNWGEVKKHAVHPLQIEQAERTIALKRQNLDLVLRATRGISLEEYSQECAEAAELHYTQYFL